MKVRKAVVTAAGRNQRTLPLQTLIDRDGREKSALKIILDEAASAGIEDICLIVWPGDEPAYREAAGEMRHALHFVEQAEPLGYGNAILCARDFAGNEPFLHLVGDHVYCNSGAKSCAEQLVKVAETEDCAVSSVQSLREGRLPYYGAVGGRRVHGLQHLYEIDRVLEKPTPTEGEQHLIVPGLRAGYYLCFFGMHVLTPAVMELLAGGIDLSAALDRLTGVERYLALEVQGQSYDIGVKYGLFTAQMALGLQGVDREDVLALMVEMLASREKRAAREEISVQS